MFLLWGEEKPKKGLTPARRAALVLRFSKGRCFECGKKFDYSGLDVHHIKERSKGGSNKLTNLTILCAGCHRALKFGYIDRSKLKPILKPKMKPKIKETKRVAIRDGFGNVVGYRTVKIRKPKSTTQKKVTKTRKKRR
jgi:5-methylcytosine-specific restriction endonuclease McrA